MKQIMQIFLFLFVILRFVHLTQYVTMNCFGHKKSITLAPGGGKFPFESIGDAEKWWTIVEQIIVEIDEKLNKNLPESRKNDQVDEIVNNLPESSKVNDLIRNLSQQSNIAKLAINLPENPNIEEFIKPLISMYEIFDAKFLEHMRYNWGLLKRRCQWNRKVKQHQKLLCLCGETIVFVQSIYNVLKNKKLVEISEEFDQMAAAIFGQMWAIFRGGAASRGADYLLYNLDFSKVENGVKAMMKSKNLKKINGA